MNENAKKWVDALRAGKYKQGKGMSDETYQLTFMDWVIFKVWGFLLMLSLVGFFYGTDTPTCESVLSGLAVVMLIFFRPWRTWVGDVTFGDSDAIK